jgi:hypothetical protein
MDELVGGVFSYNSTAKTLTGTTAFATVADGATPTTNDRILVNIPEYQYNGIYKVSNVGSATLGDFPVLTRDTDAGGPLSATVLGLGYDLFDGVTVKSTHGNDFDGRYWTLNANSVAGSCDLDGASINLWVLSDNTTADQMCVMFHGGYYTAIATGPTYSTGL